MSEQQNPSRQQIASMEGSDPAQKDRTALRRLLNYLLPYKGMLIVAMMAMIVTATTSSMIAVLVGKLTDQGFYEKDPTAMWWAPSALLVIALIHGLSTFTSSLFLQRSRKACSTSFAPRCLRA